MRSACLLAALAFPVFAQNDQTGDLNTATIDSTIESNNQTTNNYGSGAGSEIPPPTAMTPSMMFNGSDSCLIGVGGGLQVQFFGASAGLYKQDEECNRRRDARQLNELGMQIAAIARMCQSVYVWKAMFEAGTFCPILIRGELRVGRAAFSAMKMNPELFIPDYKGNKDYYESVLDIGAPDETEGDTASISERFRTSPRNADAE